jgi:PEP-CTERM motif-containing protein
MFIHSSRIGVLGISAAVLLGGGAAAEAGLLSANSGGALPGFTGTQLFDEPAFFGIPGLSMSANVDYAVFAPGTFNAAFPGQDTSAGADYVYAYQIENLDNNISKITVGLDGDETLGTVGFIGDPGLIDPVASSFVGAGPTSAAWDFDQASLPSGSSSAVLFFTSAQAPELDSSTVLATNSVPNAQNLPSPLPEPATLGLLAMGLVVGLGRRRRA